MIYKSSNVVNFAHGNLAGLGRFPGLRLHRPAPSLQLSWGCAVLLTLGDHGRRDGAQLPLIAPLVFKSDLTSTIATLGIGLIVQGVTQLMFGADVVSTGPAAAALARARSARSRCLPTTSRCWRDHAGRSGCCTC